MRVADQIFAQLAEFGIDQAFVITGGAAMHLNDALGGNSQIRTTYMHHEQACAIAAEAYFRVSGKPAILCVTAGPGLLNSLTGIAGAFTDSIPMIVVAGQVKTETLSDVDESLRQLGDQEIRTEKVVQSLAKHFVRLSAKESSNQIARAYWEAISGRPGPVVLEVPLDIQASEVPDLGHVKPTLAPKPTTISATQVNLILDELSSASRPLILAGSGVAISNTREDLRKFAEGTNVPVATAWMHDVFESNHPLYAGRAGTIGTRPGNFAVQAADLILVLGSRLNIRQTGYNFESFATNARIVWVDIDSAELRKPHIKPDVAITGDLSSVLPNLVSHIKNRRFSPKEEWLEWIRHIRVLEPKPADYPSRDSGINPYHLVMEVDQLIEPDSIVACGDATACIVPFQTISTREGRRLFSNSGIASMGYDLPAAIGASLASTKPVVCFAGDGSIMMNLQELATLSATEANIVLLILENGGYLSIRQTQENFFKRAFGSGPSSGVPFPNFEKVVASFGLPVTSLYVREDWKQHLAELFSGNGPRVGIAHLDPQQEFEPRIKSRQTSAGIYSPPLDDMHPPLPEKTLAYIRGAALGEFPLDRLSTEILSGV